MNKKYEQAWKKLQDVLGDKSVSKQEYIDSLSEMISDLEMMQTSAKEELEREEQEQENI